MTKFMIDEEDEEEINEFIHMPDEVMETVEAVASQKRNWDGRNDEVDFHAMV